jgi:hexosaminidase
MKFLPLILLVALFSCQSGMKSEEIAVIPKPASVSRGSGYFNMTKGLIVSIKDDSLRQACETFATEVKDLVPVAYGSDNTNNIEVALDNNVPGGDEAYKILVTRNKITISASNRAGVFYGLQTLRQMILFGKQADGTFKVPCVEIKDQPRFAWRGFMVDESRHFFGREKIEQLLDVMALHKLNRFHWHLTDEPGWRIEIKKYPNLTLIGGKGNYHDPDAPAAFYTQEEIKEIVKYAADRFITIIPEVDMPGHATAANRAYPEFSGGGSARYPDFTFNPGKEGTYTYLTNILREITGLIPSPYLSTGGDEVSFGTEHWSVDPDVQKLMKKENLKDLKEVESYFNHRMADSVKSLNRTLAGWDEMVDTKIDPANSVVMWWRHDKTDQLLKALDNNYKVVLSPRIPLYFDFVQDKSHQWGRKSRGAGCTEELVYNFPPDTLPGFKEKGNQILGIQANLWTEVIQNNERFDYMTYPRISALAEAAWTQNSQKDYAGFTVRLKKMLTYFDQLKLYYYNPFDPAKTPEPAGVKRPEVKK